MKRSELLKYQLSFREFKCKLIQTIIFSASEICLIFTFLLCINKRFWFNLSSHKFTEIEKNNIAFLKKKYNCTAVESFLVYSSTPWRLEIINEETRMLLTIFKTSVHQHFLAFSKTIQKHRWRFVGQCCRHKNDPAVYVLLWKATYDKISA